MYPNYDEMEAYTRESARKWGIDPDVGVRALRAEGLQPNTWQSNSRGGKYNRREPSYGPGQLLVGGPGTGYGPGMGNEFMQRYKKHPSDPSTWKENIDFTFENVQKGGWGKWYGPQKIGITGRYGVGPVPTNYQAMNLGPSEDNMNGKGDFGDLSGLPPNPTRTPLEQAYIEQFGAIPVEGLQTSVGTNKRDKGDFTPMAQAMQLGPSGGVDNQGLMNGFAYDAAMDGPPSPNNGGGDDEWSLKKGLLGAGMGLSSISNPAGAAVAQRHLEDMNTSSKGLTAYQAAMLGLKSQSNDIAAGKAEMDMKLKANEANKERNKGMSAAQQAAQGIGDMMEQAKQIRGSQDLQYITGGWSLVPNMPGGKAAALQAKVDNFRNRGVFRFLQAMREASPTGGALGQVSNQENDRMEKAFAILDQKVGTADFQNALQIFEQEMARSMENVARAYEADYGEKMPGYKPLDYGGGSGGSGDSRGGNETLYDASDYF